MQTNLIQSPSIQTNVQRWKPGVFLTVDAECSMGGAWADPNVNPVPPARGIMGQFGDRQLGLPMIVDIFNRFGLSGTFFIEVFNEDLGYQGQTRPVCEYLLDHGQDVQLHIHPNHKHFALHRQGLPFVFNDYISDLSVSAQRTLLAEGVERLTRWTGRAPVAFRAGNMGASESFLEQLRTAGIRIDSSYSFPLAGGQCRFSGQDPFNGSRWYGDVLELALSGFYQPRVPGVKPAKLLDLVGISFSECRNAITRITEAGADAVLIMHSFSLFKVRNAQYDGGRPDHIVIRRLRRLCRWLQENRDRFPTYTCSQLARAIDEKQYVARHVPPCRLSGARAFLRKAIQAYNTFYWT